MWTCYNPITLFSTVMNGSDVIIAQNLIARFPGVIVALTQLYDPQTAQAVKAFQQRNSIPVTGEVDPVTAQGIQSISKINIPQCENGMNQLVEHDNYFAYFQFL